MSSLILNDTSILCYILLTVLQYFLYVSTLDHSRPSLSSVLSAQLWETVSLSIVYFVDSYEVYYLSISCYDG